MAHTNTATAIKTLLASALLASGIGVLTPLATATTAAPAAEIHDLVINTDTEEQLELVSWALGRFEEAGLALRSLTINAHSARAGCNGLSYLSHSENDELIIHTCGVDFTLLHGLAHAWDKNSPDDETRDEFLKLAQATTWNNAEN